MSQDLPVRKETKVLEGDEECKAPRVKRECKASWVYLVDTANKALWEVKEKEEKRVKKVNDCKRQSRIDMPAIDRIIHSFIILGAHLQEGLTLILNL